ncbi:MAG TPA: DMT family transporter [Burkholderiales bacterium]|nr:DMT family transporter [Burkholderiales bacterium]
MTPRLGIAALMLIATIFGANHVAARVAFDHGTSVSAAVAMRSAATAVVLFLMLRMLRVPLGLGQGNLGKALAVGVLVAIQSYCLYSSVALIPVALALLVFNVYPMLFMLLAAATGKEAIRPSALIAMPVALVGLALVLDVRLEGWDARWRELGAGVAWALGAGVSFSLVLFCNAHWLKAMDGRVRTLAMMVVTAAILLVLGAASGTMALPRDGTGWIGLVLLTLLYGIAITSLFTVLPRVTGGASSTVALNFEPIAVLGIAWVVLGQAFKPLQIVGALVVVGAIAWLSLAKR